MKIRHAAQWYCLFCFLTAPGAALAQNYPTKTIRLIVPFPAAGTADIMARILGRKFTDTWTQQVVIDNRPGAAGNIAAELAAKAAPDGYTLFLCYNGTHATNASLYRRLPYDPVKDFVAIAPVSRVPNILVVHPSLPARSVRELIALAKARPGQLDFGSTGSGTSTHMAGELFKLMGRVDIVHVPYKGNPQALTDLISGRLTMMITTAPSVISFIRAGKLRALAVASLKRTPAAPEIITMEEAGLRGFESSAWFGLTAPAGTAREIVAKLNAEVARILELADVKANLADQGAEPLPPMSPEQFAEFMRAETDKWAKVVKASGARVD